MIRIWGQELSRDVSVRRVCSSMKWRLASSFFITVLRKPFLDSFKQSLSAFVHYFSLHSTPERYGSVTLQHVIPYRTKVSGGVPQRYYNEIEESNRLASLAWGDFDALVGWLRENVVEAFDIPLEQVWRAKPDICSEE